MPKTPWNENQPCRRCGTTTKIDTGVVFKNCATHIEIRCSHCGKHFRYRNKDVASAPNVWHEVRGPYHEVQRADVEKFLGKPRAPVPIPAGKPEAYITPLVYDIYGNLDHSGPCKSCGTIERRYEEVSFDGDAQPYMKVSCNACEKFVRLDGVPVVVEK